MAERQARRPRTGEARFAAYLEAIAAVLGDVRRAASARAIACWSQAPDILALQLPLAVMTISACILRVSGARCRAKLPGSKWVRRTLMVD